MRKIDHRVFKQLKEKQNLEQHFEHYRIQLISWG